MAAPNHFENCLFGFPDPNYVNVDLYMVFLTGLDVEIMPFQDFSSVLAAILNISNCPRVARIHHPGWLHPDPIDE